MKIHLLLFTILFLSLNINATVSHNSSGIKTEQKQQKKSTPQKTTTKKSASSKAISGVALRFTDISWVRPERRDYFEETQVRWVQLWEGGPKWAEYNYGSTSIFKLGSPITGVAARVHGEVYQGTSEDKVTLGWGEIWGTPTYDDFKNLIKKCNYRWVNNYKGSGVSGCLVSGKGKFQRCTLFFPTEEFHNIIDYWTSTNEDVYVQNCITFKPNGIEWGFCEFTNRLYVRPVLIEGNKLHSPIFPYSPIDINNYRVGNISLSIKDANLVINEEIKIDATVSPSTAHVKTLKWTSSDDDVAKVYYNGVVKGVSKGTATITATSQDGTNKSSSVEINVVNPSLHAGINSGRCGDKAFFKFDTETGILKISGKGRIEEFMDNYDSLRESVKTIVIENGIEEIGENSGIINTNTGESWEQASPNVFSRCPYLTKISIPNSVKSIATGAFYGCISLSSIEIPSSVKHIGEGAFEGCKMSLYNIKNNSQIKLKGLKIYKGTEKDGLLIQNDTLMFCRPYVKNAIIPNNVTCIGESAFGSGNYGPLTPMEYWKSLLESVYIPNSVRSIEESAFAYTQLQSIIIPNSVTYIGESAFVGCKNLQSVNIPEAVKIIKERTFLYCENLTNIEIPSSVKCIEEYAFSDCDLRTLTIPENIIELGSNSFGYNKNLTCVIIKAKKLKLPKKISDSPFICCYLERLEKSKFIPNNLFRMKKNGQIIERNKE